MNLHWLDLFTLSLPLSAVLVIAWRVRRYTKSVADFLSASRCAGRYVVCVASGEAAYGVITAVAMFELIGRAGFTLTWWNNLAVLTTMIITVTGYVIYRYRETRAMTLAQFFEVRYSRKFRVFAGMLAFVSGTLNYGIFPAVSAHFFVNYCGLPQTVSVAGLVMPTFAILMVVFVSIAVFLALTGGQITIMVTDCLEGLFSGVFYVIVAIALLCIFSWSQISEAMTHVPKGQSMLNPFDTAAARDFNIWFVLIGCFNLILNQMAWQGGHAYRASAISPHEAKMGGILGGWRNISRLVMVVLLGICAYTYMNHQDFASGAAQVNQRLQNISDPQIRSQMSSIMALSHFLPPGIWGMFAAIMFFAMVAVDSTYTHSWGTIFIQDVLLPLRKKPFTPEQHIRLLRWAIVGVALFAIFFSLVFVQTGYIMMFQIITAAIFTGGAGCAIVGGLYWNKGTTAAAWAGMLTGSILAVCGMLLQQPAVWHVFRSWQPEWPAKFPINSQVTFFFAMVSSVTVYVVVSLLTCRENFNMDRMLHRGKYAIEGGALDSAKRKWHWSALLGFDPQFTKGDKLIAGGMFSYTMFWFATFVVMSVWYLLSPWPLSVWSNYWYLNQVIVPIVIGVITAVWYTWGGIRDLIRLFASLRTVKRNALDDGTVIGRHNTGEPESEEQQK